MTPNQDLPPSRQPSWFSKNWMWLAGGGCFAMMTCCGVFGLGAYLTVSKVIEGSGAFAEAFAKTSQNPEVTAALGAPLTPGFGMSGSIKEQNNGGTADFTVPLKGSKGSGSMHVVARKNAGTWTFQKIDVEAGGKTIDVLAGAKDEPPPPDDGPGAPPPREDEEPPPEAEPDGD